VLDGVVKSLWSYKLLYLDLGGYCVMLELSRCRTSWSCRRGLGAAGFWS